MFGFLSYKNPPAIGCAPIYGFPPLSNSGARAFGHRSRGGRGRSLREEGSEVPFGPAMWIWRSSASRVA